MVKNCLTKERVVRESNNLPLFLLFLLLSLLTVGSRAASSEDGGDVWEVVFPLGVMGGAVGRGGADVTPQSPLTICMWLKASLKTAAARILSYFRGSCVILVTRSGTMISVRTEQQLIDVYDFDLTPREWHQVCVIRHHTLKVQLVLDGRSFASTNYPDIDEQYEDRSKRNSKAIVAMLNRTVTQVGGNFTGVPLIILGGLDSKFDSPVGRIADPRLYKKILTVAELAALRTCNEKVPKGDEIKLLYTTEAVVLRGIKRQTLCWDDETLVVTYPAYTRYGDAEALCAKLGGSLPAPTTFMEFTKIADTIPEYSNRNEMFFWLSTATNRTAIGVVGEEECCVQDVRYGSSMPMIAPCKSWARDFVCYVAANKSVYLLYTEVEIQLFYGDGKENYLLVSDKGYSLTSENNTYVIRNLVGSVMGVRDGRQVSAILGMQLWTNKGEESMLVTLSTCLAKEFTCRNGECLALEKRCDKWPDCEDASDEDHCRYLLPPPANYRSFLPPSDNTAVSLKVDITDLHDINMKENQLGITVQVDMYWTDGRLTFTNMATNKTRLDEAMGMIWTPQIVFIGAKYEDNVNLQKGVNDMRFLFAQSTSKGYPAVVNSSRALKQDGKDVRLHLQLILDLTVTCSYDLTLYPFDVQDCGLALTLGVELTGNTYWDPEDLHIDKSLPQPALYGVSNVRLKTRSTTQVEVRFLLERWYGSYMLTSYFPCLILLIIGTTTLAYPVHAVSDRVMVTLSCLIVLASLLAQASATLPESASSKAIEVWFFYTIARMFLVSVVHTAVYRSNHQDSLSVTSLARSSIATHRKTTTGGRGGGRVLPGAGGRVCGGWVVPPSLTPTQRVNRLGLLLGLSLDLLFFAIYVSYVVFTRRAVRANVS